jgi:hypothetical protein
MSLVLFSTNLPNFHFEYVDPRVQFGVAHDETKPREAARSIGL